MAFNSLIFLFQFLPFVILLYFLMPPKARNPILLVVSLVFYAWGGISLTVILVASVLLNYFWGRLLQQRLTHPGARIILIAGVTINLLLLLYFKYMPFFAENILFHGRPDLLFHSEFKKIVAPLGLSFLVFQSISYLVDIYQEKISAEKNIVKLSLYFVFFPRVLSGPIVRYAQISEDLTQRTVKVENFASGIERFALGMAKKVIIANTFAAVADAIFQLPINELGIYTAWLGATSYFFQIYFDFSGYTDMAIGIAAMFGIRLPENFNYPYTAKSIQEFWQRWHITLSTWLRDYLFSPLSIGMRNIGKTGLVLSLLITFTLCGLWHGAGWNFIVWGSYFGVFLSLEAVGFSKILKKLHFSLQSIYVVAVVLFGWVIFRSDTLDYAKNYISIMLGLSSGAESYKMAVTYFNLEFTIVFLIAVSGATGLFKFITTKISSFLNTVNPLRGSIKSTFSFLYIFGVLALFILSVMYISSGSYNPFIYFRF